MTRVSLQACNQYDYSLIKAHLSDALAAIGFNPASWHGARVGLKPNLLLASAPEKAIITHPEFVRAAAELVHDHGGKPVLIESPPFTPLPKMTAKAGYDGFIRELNMDAADDRAARTLVYPNARRIKSIEISEEYFNIDFLLNLPKLKTHGLTYISGAVKNLFGALPGITKSKMHLRFPEPDEFAEWLLDLTGAFITLKDGCGGADTHVGPKVGGQECPPHPHLQDRKFLINLNEAGGADTHVGPVVGGQECPPHPYVQDGKFLINLMDAIVGQEGEGPGPAGIPRPIGAIIIGADPVAVDHVATRVLGLDPARVPTLVHAPGRDFCVGSFADVDVIGARIEDLQLHDFVPTRATISSHFMRGRLVGPLMKNLLMDRPVPDPAKCSLCYQCKSICPASAIAKASPNRRTPHYDYTKCIRCFCCLEICPEAAISVRRGRLQWVVELGLRRQKPAASSPTFKIE